MEKLFEINVKINDGIKICGKNEDVNLLYFTGDAAGKYFNGKILGTGTDTQHIKKDGSMTLSARYVLEGKDIESVPCRIFIDNSGSFEKGFFPVIVTDSKALSRFEGAPLKAEIEGEGDSVKVTVFG